MADTYTRTHLTLLHYDYYLAVFGGWRHTRTDSPHPIPNHNPLLLHCLVRIPSLCPPISPPLPALSPPSLPARLQRGMVGEAKLHEEAIRHRGALPDYDEAKAGLTKLLGDGGKMRAEARRQHGMLNQLRERLMEESGGARPTDERMMQHMSQVHQSMQRNLRNSQMIQKLEEQHFGPNMALFNLFPNCYASPVINEKRLKGGTPNVVPRIYQFTLCPFIQISQIELNHTNWVKHEAKEKAGRAPSKPPSSPPRLEHVAVGVDGVEADATDTRGTGEVEAVEETVSESSLHNEYGELNNATETSEQTILGVWGSWNTGGSLKVRLLICLSLFVFQLSPLPLPSSLSFYSSTKPSAHALSRPCTIRSCITRMGRRVPTALIEVSRCTSRVALRTRCCVWRRMGCVFTQCGLRRLSCVASITPLHCGESWMGRGPTE